MILKHCDCVHFLNLDCEKGMCSIRKEMIMIDGSESGVCEMFEAAKFCSNCINFSEPDKYGIGVCRGFEKENWAYATCGAFGCEKYQSRLR